MILFIGLDSKFKFECCLKAEIDSLRIGVWLGFETIDDKNLDYDNVKFRDLSRFKHLSRWLNLTI